MKSNLALALLLSLASLSAYAFGWFDGRSSTRSVHRPARAAIVAPAPQKQAPPPLEVEANALASAMCAYLTDVDHVDRRQCETRNLAGLAKVIVTEVDRMHRNGEWVPISRHGAPALLAACSRFEVNWEWQTPQDGALGEVGVFQTGSGAVSNAGYEEEHIRRNPYSSTRTAILWMDEGRTACGDHPARWLGWYATRGICGGASRPVRKRIEAASWMRRYQERAGG